MQFNATLAKVLNRGVPSASFLTELVEWGRSAPDELFLPNNNYDIYNKVKPELGPYTSLLHRKAVMLEVLRVLIMFESSGKWGESVDKSRRSSTTNENAEAGASQVSWNNRRLDPSLKTFLSANGIEDGTEFQYQMKTNHKLMLEFTARLLRIDVKDFNRINNGPVRKVEGYNGKDERRATDWRSKFYSADESIYPWLSRDAVSEFEQLLV